MGKNINDSARFKLGFWGSVIALLIFALGVWKLIELITNYF